MELKPLHDVPKYITECADVLNEEWKRSLTARLHSLEKSRENLPICLVLLEKDSNGTPRVVAHSRLSDIQGQATKSCLVESVVVKKLHRGKGYGRIVMEKTEQFAASKGYQTMYLTTHDKQEFYGHLGYEYCSPVISIGSDILPDHLMQKLMGSMNITSTAGDASGTSHTSKPKQSSADSKGIQSMNSACGSMGTESQGGPTSPCIASLSAPPAVPPQPEEALPPPPPPPGIAPPPPSPGGPPPPPPAPVPMSSKVDKGGDKTVTKWDPSKVSWMKKTL